MSFAAPSRQRIGPVLPLAALVDVLFLLLIFFMTTSIFREQDQYVQVVPPVMEMSQAGRGSPPLTVTIDQEGNLYIGQRHYEELSSLAGTLGELHKTADAVVIRCDEAASYGRYSQVEDVALQVGFGSISRAVTKKAP